MYGVILVSRFNTALITYIMDTYISQTDAWDFIENTLGMKDPRGSMQKDKLIFLSAMARSFLNRIPFHNMAHMCVPLKERSTPSVEQNVSWVTTGFGGLCWTLNTAMYCILRSIGFDATLVLCSVHIQGANDHVAVIVKGVKVSGDRYLIDVGFASPCFTAINMNFQQESEVFEESHCVYKIVKDGNMYVRTYRSREYVDGDSSTGNHIWKAHYYFNLDEFDLDALFPIFNQLIYANPEQIFGKALYLVRFTDDRMTAIKNTELLSENSHHILECTELKSDDEIREAIVLHFPEITPEMARCSVLNWRTQQAQC